MAQPKVNLASALANLYISRGGSGTDITANDDSADIVAKLYHLLGGNVATPKGMPMAKLVTLLSTTQGGGGGGSSSLIVTENDVNDAQILTQAQLTYMDGVVGGNITLNSGSKFAVQMSQDTDIYSFKISGNTGKIDGQATYDSEYGAYVYETSQSLGTSTNFTVTFEKQIK